MHDKMVFDSPFYNCEPKHGELASLCIEVMENYLEKIIAVIFQRKFREAFEKMKGYHSAMRSEDEFWVSYEDGQNVQNVCSDICNIWTIIFLGLKISESYLKTKEKQVIIELIQDLCDYGKYLAEYGLDFSIDKDKLTKLFV